MLMQKRCPHTGIINFFATTDPNLAIGAATTSDRSNHVSWRFYLDDATAGWTRDLASAERLLAACLHAYERDVEVAVH
jgi:hypothetical protein